jgi:hypothetical protein
MELLFIGSAPAANYQCGDTSPGVEMYPTVNDEWQRSFAVTPSIAVPASPPLV